jgi:secreted PhoX family phosphatase
VVEIDPADPTMTPIKRTALGRAAHEGATVATTKDGRAVVYMGEDAQFEYIYKFVSRDRIQPGGFAANRELLDHGTLYVARFDGGGTGQWMEVRHGSRGLTAANGFADQGEVMVKSRQASDLLGATKMDRPEDFEANPKTGKLYVALTNNTKRGAPEEPGADAANPRNDNKSGQVLEITDDHAGTSFSWNLLLVCGDPAAADTYYGGFDKSKVSPISCPDNLAFDGHGNLWIATDGNALDSNDGLFAVALEGPHRGETRQFLTVPLGAETCGPVITDDLVMVCVQHPGEHDDNSVDDPLSHWPEGAGGTARPAVVAVWKDDGQIGM